MKLSLVGIEKSRVIIYREDRDFQAALCEGTGPGRLVVRKKVYILGGWFGRLYGALELERRLGQESNIRKLLRKGAVVFVR